MSYFQELKDNWRPILAATLGLSTGASVGQYITSALAPDMVENMNWAQSSFTAVGVLSLGTAIAIPMAGRMADVLGVKRTAMIGLIALPLIYFAYSLIRSSIAEYAVLFVMQAILCATTTATVYSRIAVQFFTRTRGLALAIVASGPAVMGAALSPLLNRFVDDFGWRDSYQAIALFTAIMGVIVYLLIPAEKQAEGQEAPVKRRARDDYPMILRKRAFWLLAGSMLFINLPQVIAITQLRFVLEAQNVTAAQVGILFSIFAVGTLAGRIIAGLALDRLPPHIVAFVGMALPALGLAVLASDMDALPVLMLAVFSFGFVIGAEGDVVGYLISRTFPITVYSSVMGLMTMIISLSVVSGTAILSIMQKMGMGYPPFLWMGAAAIIIGSLFFLPLGRNLKAPENKEKTI